jgi:hypothetical protein
MAGVVATADAHGQRKPPAVKAAQKKAKEEAKKKADVLNAGELDMLRKAYVLLAGANHDYDGHRVKAMGAVNAAAKILEGSLVKKGTPQQKAALPRKKPP